MAFSCRCLFSHSSSYTHLIFTHICLSIYSERERVRRKPQEPTKEALYALYFIIIIIIFLFLFLFYFGYQRCHQGCHQGRYQRCHQGCYQRCHQGRYWRCYWHTAYYFRREYLAAAPARPRLACSFLLSIQGKINNAIKPALPLNSGGGISYT